MLHCFTQPLLFCSILSDSYALTLCHVPFHSGCDWDDIVCPELGPPANGRVDICSLSPNITVRYSCDVGFELSSVSREVLTCLSTKQWSGKPPTCVKDKFYCPLLFAPRRGQVSVSGRSINSTATYSCDKGRSLSGNRTRTCQSDGTWSGRKPSCTGRLFCVFSFNTS